MDKTTKRADIIGIILKNPFLLAVVSAILLRLSYPKFNIWILAWFAFVPLFFAIERQKPVKVFLTSLFSGTLFFILMIFWLIHVTVPGMIILSIYLGLYVAFFSLGYALLKERIAFWQRLVLMPSLWVLLEFFRGNLLTGFPWALLAYSQTSNLINIQAADLFGAYGVSFIVIFVNVLIFEFIAAFREKPAFNLRRFYIPLLVLLCWWTYGYIRINEAQKKSCPFKVAMVQGNISQEIKWVYSFHEKIFKKYQLLTEIVHLKNEPDLVIWPETSFPDYLESGINDEPLKEFTRQIETPLLVGSIRLKNLRYYNSALLFLPSGKIAGIYDKIHLVPFGEYIPARRFLPFLGTILPIEDFSPGMKYQIFSVKAGNAPVRFGVLICFEDIFSDLARNFVRRGADFLVNITNDAWFGDTSSPYQHMQASVFRAVENRVFVVRSANTGISCIIDDVGRVGTTVKDQKGKETFVMGYQTGFVCKPGRSSIYTKIGDVFAVLCGLYSILMIFLYLSRRKS